MAFDAFADLFANRAPLQHVVGYFFAADRSPMLVALCLAFADRNVFLIARDDDSIEFATHWPTGHEQVSERTLDHELPWNHCVSIPILWAWQLTNQFGYVDGVQIDFAHSVADDIVRVQLLVVGSELKVQ